MGDVDQPSTDVVQKHISCESYDNDCNEYINSDLKRYCDLPTEIQNGIIDKLNGDIISVSNSSNIHVGAKIGKVIVDTFTVVSSAKDVKHNPYKRKLILGILSSLCLGAVIACIVYFSYFTESELDWFVKRKSWGARDAKHLCTVSEEEQVVVEVVLFHTKTELCYDFYGCSEIVRNIQAEDLTDILATDIKFNFLIGGDGKVYEGLDWHCKGEHVFLPFFSLHVGIIGDFSKRGHNNRLSDLQKGALRKLFQYGVEKGKLYDKFGITPACCYKNASDPGENILNEIVHWPEFVWACGYTTNCDYSDVADMESLLLMNHTRTAL